MDDALLMRRVESVGDLNRDVEQAVGREGSPFRDTVAQRFPFQQWHHQKRLARMLSEFMDRADIGMIQSGGGARFPFKSLHRLGIVSKLFGKKLDSNAAAQPEIFRLVNHAHAATAQ